MTNLHKRALVLSGGGGRGPVTSACINIWQTDYWIRLGYEDAKRTLGRDGERWRTIGWHPTKAWWGRNLNKVELPV